MLKCQILTYVDTAGMFTNFVLDLQQSVPEEKAMANSLSSALMAVRTAERGEREGGAE